MLDQVLDGAGRREARVDPAAEADERERPAQPQRTEVFQLTQGVVGLAHCRAV
jgi:hypothetical protein